MQLGHLKYILVSALIGAFAWFAILEIADQAHTNIFWSLRIAEIATTSIVPAIIAVILGTYIGLWAIGRIRTPSFSYGILVGLLSFVLFLPFYFVLVWIGLSMVRAMGWPFRLGMEQLMELVTWYITQYGLIDVIVSVVAGLLGTIIVRRISPSFCPYCGNKLPSGRDPCPKCGKMP